MAGGDKVVMRAALLIVLAACTTPPRARTEPLGELVVAEAELVSSLRRGMAEGMTWRLAVREVCADGTWRLRVADSYSASTDAFDVRGARVGSRTEFDDGQPRTSGATVARCEVAASVNLLEVARAGLRRSGGWLTAQSVTTLVVDGVDQHFLTRVADGDFSVPLGEGAHRVVWSTSGHFVDGVVRVDEARTTWTLLDAGVARVSTAGDAAALAPGTELDLEVPLRGVRALKVGGVAGFVGLGWTARTTLLDGGAL